jgi:DNA gyrase/topoisomerase IV subunit B
LEPLCDILRVRKRPGVFVGDIADSAGLDNLGLGLVTGAIGEILAGRAAQMQVQLCVDDVTSVWRSGPETLPSDELEAFATVRREAATSL